jgi:hypothetical protein
LVSEPEDTAVVIADIRSHEWASARRHVASRLYAMARELESASERQSNG